MLGSVSYMRPGRVNHTAPDRLCHRALGRINHRGPGGVSNMVLGKVYYMGPGSNRHKRRVWCISPRLWMVRSRPLTIAVGKGYYNWCSCDDSQSIKCGYNGYRKKFHVDLVYNGLFFKFPV